MLHVTLEKCFRFPMTLNVFSFLIFEFYSQKLLARTFEISPPLSLHYVCYYFSSLFLFIGKIWLLTMASAGPNFGDLKLPPHSDFSPALLFCRVQVVTIVDGYFMCSCCAFERAGIPCQHIAAIMMMIDPNWAGFTHHDVAVRWWTSYIMFGYRYNNESTRELSRLLHRQRVNDIKGPSALGLPLEDVPIVPSVTVTEPLMLPNESNASQSAIFCCKNYPQEYLSSLSTGWDVHHYMHRRDGYPREYLWTRCYCWD